MKNILFFSIAARIVFLFGLTILATYLPQYYPAHFFNDHGDVWGIRHYWYNIMLGCLFILSVVDFIVTLVNLLDKHYPNLGKP